MTALILSFLGRFRGLRCDLPEWLPMQVAEGVCTGLGIDYGRYVDDELVGGSSEDETVYRFAGASP